MTKENNLGPGEKIRYIRDLKAQFLFCKVQLVCAYFHCLNQMLSFYEIKSFTRPLWNTDLILKFFTTSYFSVTQTEKKFIVEWRNVHLQDQKGIVPNFVFIPSASSYEMCPVSNTPEPNAL